MIEHFITAFSWVWGVLGVAVFYAVLTDKELKDNPSRAIGYSVILCSFVPAWAWLIARYLKP